MTMQLSHARDDGDSVGSATDSAGDQGGTRPSPKSTRSRPRLLVYAVRLSLLIIILALWQYSADRWINGLFTSRPSDIWIAWREWVADGTLGSNTARTLISAAYGLLIGGSAAVVFGYTLGVVKFLGEVFSPFITAFYALPIIALVPLLVIWVGIGTPLEVTICSIVVFFLLFYNIFYGIRDVNPALIDAIRIMGGRRRDVALRVRVPSALIWVVAGLKIAVPQALVAVVITEMLASGSGLGYLVQTSAGQFDTAGTFAAILSILALGIIADRLVTLVTRRALAWRGDGDR